MNTRRLAAISMISLCALFLSRPALGEAPRDLSALAFMAGSWGGTEDGVEMEERWTPPKGGSMLAVHRDVQGARTVSFEFLRIETTAQGLVYQASPMGRPATSFPLVEAGGKRAVFENPAHEFPRRILYWLAGDGALHARIEGTRQGKPASMEWTWRRLPEP